MCASFTLPTASFQKVEHFEGALVLVPSAQVRVDGDEVARPLTAFDEIDVARVGEVERSEPDAVREARECKRGVRFVLGGGWGERK